MSVTEQWRQRYVLGKRQPPNMFLINGRADHAAIERSMEQKVTSHSDLPTGEVLEFFENKFTEEIEAEGGVSEIEVRDSDNKLVRARSEKRKQLDIQKRNGLGMVGHYHQLISPNVQPVAVEKKFELRPGSLPVKVVGRIDLLADVINWEGPDPVRQLIDRKTTRKKKSRLEPEWVVQAEIYQLVDPVPHHWHISSVPMHVDTGKWINPKPPRIAMTQLEHTCGEIGYYMRRYGPDEEWPARGKLHSWACNYCGFRPDCWAWKED